MGRDRLKMVEVRYFLVPFLIMITGFSILAVATVKNRVQQKYATLEERTLEIAKSYSHNLAHTSEAFDMISSLLDEKIQTVAQAITLIENKQDNEALANFSKNFAVDEISLYNSEGEITYSTHAELIGWKAYEGHPVHDFMMSGETKRTENIRQDTENGLYYKFGYVKDGNGGFVQLGVLAENIQGFLEEFEVDRLIKEISERNDVAHVFSINNKFEIINSSLPNYTGTTIDEEALRAKFVKEEGTVKRVTMAGDGFFRVAVPIYVDHERAGMLVVDWSTDKLDAQVYEIIRFGAVVLLVIILTTGSILYYAYLKNKANIKIAYYDGLTGLRNSQYMHDHLQKKLRIPGRRNKAILLLDIRSLKTFTMTYGFFYGDEMLKQIADKIRKILITDEAFFRFDGHRFVVVIDKYADQEELKRLAEKLIHVFDDPITLGTESHYVDAAIAVVEIKGRHISTGKILQDAMLTLSHIPSGSVHPIAFFSEKMEKKLQRQDNIIKVLRDVVEGKDTNSFYLEYQPKLDLAKDEIIGFEALARLRTEELGQVPPDEFIALAEEKLLINELGNHVILLASGFLERMQAEGFGGVTVAVNISGIQLLREDFVESLQNAAHLSDKVLRSLEFEITESVLLDHYDQINEKLEAVKKMGIAVSLDDFGTGFSSLWSIGELHIDTVKIDRFFINKISHLPDEDLIAADIISMAHKIGLLVVAEGVEDERQKAYLQQYGCDIIQGYLFSKPLSATDAIAFLRGQQRHGQA